MPCTATVLTCNHSVLRRLRPGRVGRGMTSEVALLNRSAVAIAADSAATVRRWQRHHYETYYFKGTNKIFQLSAVHPVGIMIYAAASLQGAPWDVLIKSYRDQLGNKPHDQLNG